MSAARLTDRSPEPGAKGQRLSEVTRITRSESLPTLSGGYRVSRGRLEVLRGELTATDWAIVGTLQRVRLATGRQLQLLHVTEASPLANARRARRRLEALTARRVLLRLPRRVGGLAGGSAQFVYALDTAGHRLTGPRSRGARRPWLPGPDHLRHTLAITETYVDLRLAERAAEFELLDWSTKPACWRTASGVWAGVSIKPDALVHARVAGDELGFWLEVDLATESLPVIRRKADVYWSYYQTGAEQTATSYFPQVLWLVPDERRETRLTEAIALLPAEQWALHRVARHSGLVDALLAVPP